MKAKIGENVWFAYSREIEYVAAVAGIMANNLDGRMCREIYGEEFIAKIRNKHRELCEILNSMFVGGLEFFEFLMDYSCDEFSLIEFRKYVESFSQEDFLYIFSGYRVSKSEVSRALSDDEFLAECLDQQKFQVYSFVNLKRILNHRSEFLDLLFACIDDIRTPELESALDAYEKNIISLQKELEAQLAISSIRDVTAEIINKCIPHEWNYDNHVLMPVFMLPRNALTFYCNNCITFYSKNKMVSRQKALDMIKVMSDDSRIRILDLLSEAGTANGKMISNWVRIAPSTVSHHMDLMVECGLVSEVKKGNSKEYSIDTRNVDSFIKEIEGILLKNKEYI